MSSILSSDKYTPIHYMISNKNLSCDQVSKHLCKVGMSGTVTSQTTIICDKFKEKCYMENGCLIIIYNTPILDFLEHVVKPLHIEHSLNCGYVQIKGIYTGCVKNLFRKSDC